MVHFEATRPNIKVDLKEASDVVALPDGRFLLVSDCSDEVALVDRTGETSRLKLPHLRSNESSLEAVAYDPARRHLFVAREAEGAILRYRFDARDIHPRPEFESRFSLDLDFKKNKGIEGLAFLPAAHSPTRQDRLLLAREGKPKALYLSAPSGDEHPKKIRLDGKTKSVSSDFSGLAVDPKTGHVFISSDESSLVAELRLVARGRKVRAKLLGTYPLRDAGDRLEKMEGLAFDAEGDLFVLLENASELIHYERKS